MIASHPLLILPIYIILFSAAAMYASVIETDSEKCWMVLGGGMYFLFILLWPYILYKLLKSRRGGGRNRISLITFLFFYMVAYAALFLFRILLDEHLVSQQWAAALVIVDLIALTIPIALLFYYWLVARYITNTDGEGYEMVSTVLVLLQLIFVPFGIFFIHKRMKNILT